MTASGAVALSQRRLMRGWATSPACSALALLALRVPDQVKMYRPHRPPFWRLADATARITRILAEPPHEGELGVFLPAVDDSAPEWELRCRAALASTFMAGLEFAREGKVELDQLSALRNVRIRRHQGQQIL